jgi:hypothetical protein
VRRATSRRAITGRWPVVDLEPRETSQKKARRSEPWREAGEGPNVESRQRQGKSTVKGGGTRGRREAQARSRGERPQVQGPTAERERREGERSEKRTAVKASQRGEGNGEAEDTKEKQGGSKREGVRRERSGSAAESARTVVVV